MTLTYDAAHFPLGGSVDQWELQSWLKRLRAAVSPVKIRFFASAEYGDKGRPHYHVAVFGLPAVVLGGPLFVERRGARYYCDAGSVLGKSWGNGFVSATELNEQSASYICGYVTKKLVVRNGGNKLFRFDGRRREFTRMSLRPGIGAGEVQRFGGALAELFRRGDFGLLDEVPGAFRYGGKIRSLGRYLSGKLWDSAGIPVGDVRAAKARRAVAEMQRLREVDKVEAESMAKGAQEIFVDKWRQKCLNVERRFAVFDQVRNL